MTDDAKKTEDKDEKAAKDEPRVAKPGVKDSDSIVKGAGGELMSGRIADIADGDA